MLTNFTIMSNVKKQVEKVECTVSKGCGKEFGSESINDGDKIKLPVSTAQELVDLGFVTCASIKPSLKAKKGVKK